MEETVGLRGNTQLYQGFFGLIETCNEVERVKEERDGKDFADSHTGQDHWAIKLADKCEEKYKLMLDGCGQLMFREKVNSSKWSNVKNAAHAMAKGNSANRTAVAKRLNKVIHIDSKAIGKLAALYEKLLDVPVFELAKVKPLLAARVKVLDPVKKGIETQLELYGFKKLDPAIDLKELEGLEKALHVWVHSVYKPWADAAKRCKWQWKKCTMAELKGALSYRTNPTIFDADVIKGTEITDNIAWDQIAFVIDGEEYQFGNDNELTAKLFSYLHTQLDNYKLEPKNLADLWNKVKVELAKVWCEDGQIVLESYIQSLTSKHYTPKPAGDTLRTVRFVFAKPFEESTLRPKLRIEIFYPLSFDVAEEQIDFPEVAASGLRQVIELDLYEGIKTKKLAKMWGKSLLIHNEGFASSIKELSQVEDRGGFKPLDWISLKTRK